MVKRYNSCTSRNNKPLGKDCVLYEMHLVVEKDILPLGKGEMFNSPYVHKGEGIKVKFRGISQGKTKIEFYYNAVYC